MSKSLKLPDHRIVFYMVFAALFLFIFNFFNTGPSLYKKFLILSGSDYGLVRYSLQDDCKGSTRCFTKHIPKPKKSVYNRLGDVFYGLDTKYNMTDTESTINRILSDKSFDDSFLVRYLKQMKWLEYHENKLVLTSRTSYHHDFNLAKKILLTLSSKYPAPKNDELVIYVRATDKLDSINDGTCRGNRCESLMKDYPDYVFTKASEKMRLNPQIQRITIVAANYNLKKRHLEKQHVLYNDLLTKLSTLTSSIELHSSNDLDEDIFYMATSHHFIGSSAISSLSLLVDKIFLS